LKKTADHKTKKLLKYWPFLILLGAALFRAPAWQAEQPVTDERSSSYLQPAEELAREGTYRGVETLRRTPAYPVALAAVLRFGSGSLRQVTLLQRAAGVLTALAFMLISLKLWKSGAAAFVTGWLIAFHPRIFAFENEIQSETLFLLLSGVSILLFLTEFLKAKPSRAGLLAASAAGGAAALCRPEFGLYLAVPLIFYSFKKMKTRYLLSAAGPFAGMVLLWMLRNLLMFNFFTLSPMGAITSLQTSGHLINWTAPGYARAKTLYLEALKENGGAGQNAASAVLEKLTKDPETGFLEALRQTAGLGYETLRSAPFQYLWATRKNFLDFAESVRTPALPGRFSGSIDAHFLELALLGIAAGLFLLRSAGPLFILASLLYLVFANCLVEIGTEPRRSLEILPLLALFIPVPWVLLYESARKKIRRQRTGQFKEGAIWYNIRTKRRGQ